MLFVTTPIPDYLYKTTSQAATTASHFSFSSFPSHYHRSSIPIQYLQHNQHYCSSYLKMYINTPPLLCRTVKFNPSLHFCFPSLLCARSLSPFTFTLSFSPFLPSLFYTLLLGLYLTNTLTHPANIYNVKCHSETTACPATSTSSSGFDVTPVCSVFGIQKLLWYILAVLEAKSTREQCIRVVAIAMMIIEGGWNIWVE